MGRWTYRQPEGKRAYSDMIVRSLECVSVFKLLWPIALSDLSRILCRLRFWTTVHWKRIITKGNTLHRLTVWLYMQREVAFYQGHTEAAQEGITAVQILFQWTIRRSSRWSRTLSPMDTILGSHIWTLTMTQ